MDRCEVVIVGAGPVGLLLGCLLTQHSVDVRVIEAAVGRSTCSRAIGIHPPGLRCLAKVGVADELVARGVKVRRGHAFARGEHVGSIAFDDLPAPFDFVLSVPQTETERALERTLVERDPSSLRRGVRARALHGEPGSCRLEVDEPGGGREEIEARVVVACQGKHSTLREQARIAFPGGPYSHRFMMVDARDATPFGGDGAVFLSADGLVESFPLPGAVRRWVVSLDHAGTELEVDALAAEVRARTGFGFEPASVTMVSRFTAEHFLAEHFTRGPLVLAGDSAHVMSPIGGQGMNVGWLDALALTEALLDGLRNGASLVQRLSVYEQQRRAAAKWAVRRAHWYTELGCSSGGALSRALLGLVLGRPWQPATARLFTMGSG